MAKVFAYQSVLLDGFSAGPNVGEQSDGDGAR